MKLRAALARHGGWRHRADLLDDGWTARGILSAQRHEGILQLRRKWLVLPDARADIREAARVGGVVTCTSALDRYGLWVPPEIEGHAIPHIGVSPVASEAPVDAISHRTKPVVARPARRLVDPIENVLAHIATCLPEVPAFAVWESAVHEGLATPEHLGRLTWTSLAARDLASRVGPLSDSGVESTFVARCRRAEIAVVQQVRLAGKPVDALIGRRLVVQLDGYAFHRDTAQRRKDLAHDRKLTSMGYTVLRFSYYDVMHCWAVVERDIRRAIAQGLAR
ncbi:endonuclease domain-containing protein [Microbacterium sp. G2-8]|uniref:endonuclease domain-containing protein n=1 Tax=Microbacterium sp. G2-8 TaxID=2842454 RepID=UPI001C8A9401|nr:DUF559 domain-containing protein [Microbacterium sp. G2-8]